MVGDVFVVNGEAHAMMLMGFERFGFRREGHMLILHGQPTMPPVILPHELLAAPDESNVGRKKKIVATSSRYDLQAVNEH
jgi:hypothetical protein